MYIIDIVHIQSSNQAKPVIKLPCHTSIDMSELPVPGIHKLGHMLMRSALLVVLLHAKPITQTTFLTTLECISQS